MNWIGIYKHWPAVLAASLGIIASLSLFDDGLRPTTARASCRKC
jgi:hypothetical protein